MMSSFLGDGVEEKLFRFNDIGFDDNMVGLSPGAQNVCMLAAFGNGGVVPLNCVPILGTQASLDIVGDPEVFTSLSYYNTGIGKRQSIFCLIIYCGYLVLASCFFIEGCSWMGCGSRQMNSMGFLSNTILEWRALTVASTSCPLK